MCAAYEGSRVPPLAICSQECGDKLARSGSRKCLMSSFGRTNKCLWRTAARQRWSPLSSPVRSAECVVKTQRGCQGDSPRPLCTQQALCLAIWLFITLHSAFTSCHRWRLVGPRDRLSFGETRPPLETSRAKLKIKGRLEKVCPEPDNGSVQRSANMGFQKLRNRKLKPSVLGLDCVSRPQEWFRILNLRMCDIQPINILIKVWTHTWIKATWFLLIEIYWNVHLSEGICSLLVAILHFCIFQEAQWGQSSPLDSTSNKPTKKKKVHKLFSVCRPLKLSGKHRKTMSKWKLQTSKIVQIKVFNNELVNMFFWRY